RGPHDRSARSEAGRARRPDRLWRCVSGGTALRHRARLAMGAHRAARRHARRAQDRKPRRTESPDRSQHRRRAIPRRVRRISMVSGSAVALLPYHRPTPLSARITRFARVIAHLAGGLATTVFVFPWIGPPRKRALIRRWSRQLLQMLGVELRVNGTREGAMH